MTRKTKIMIFGFLFIFIFLLTGYNLILSKTISSQNKEKALISKTVKNAYEKAYNYSYKTTTGIEGNEYFTKQFNKKNKMSTKYKNLIINSRKRQKIINTMEIQKVKDIKIDGNFATAIALYKSTSKSAYKNLNFSRTGTMESKLIKSNNKWLINEIRIIKVKPIVD